jgi:hypothetical protein
MTAACPVCVGAEQLARETRRAHQCPGCGSVFDPALPAVSRCTQCGTLAPAGHICHRDRVLIVVPPPRTAAVWTSPEVPEPDELPGDVARPPVPCRECERRAHQQPAFPLLALLEDARRIAEWDSVAAPPASGVVRPGWDGNTNGGVRLDVTDRPEWVNAAHNRLDHGRHLRDRLERLRAQARTADDAGVMMRGLAVIDWLIPRALALGGTARGEKGALQPRELHRLVAEAFTDREVWARWHPSPPQEPPKPVAPAIPSPPPTDAFWCDRRRYPGQVAGYLLAYEAHLLAVRKHPGRVDRYKEACRQHGGLVRDGKLATDTHGRDLLELATRVWFEKG